MAHDTHVAPEPSSMGCKAAARPPAEPEGTGLPSESRAKESGPRFDTTMRSEPATSLTLPAATSSNSGGPSHDSPRRVDAIDRPGLPRRLQADRVGRRHRR